MSKKSDGAVTGEFDGSSVSTDESAPTSPQQADYPDIDDDRSRKLLARVRQLGPEDAQRWLQAFSEREAAMKMARKSHKAVVRGGRSIIPTPFVDVARLQPRKPRN